jgi:two-component system OmpR family response regulator
MKKPKKKTIFIVEDNEMYSHSLKEFLITRFLNTLEIKTFYLGEMCLMELHRNPIIVIMDFLLNSKYNEANNGLEIIKRIKILRPQTNIIVLSGEKKIKLDPETIKEFDCVYVQKDQEAFMKVERFIRRIFSRNQPPAFEPWN